MNGFEGTQVSPLKSEQENTHCNDETLLRLKKSNSIEGSAQDLEQVKFFDKVAIEIGPFAVNIRSQMVSRFLAWAQRNLRMEQYRQQKQVEEHFLNNPSIEVHSFYRNPDGSGSVDISAALRDAGEHTNKIVLLLNGIVNPQDVIQANPKLAKLATMLLRLHPKNIIRHGFDAKKILKGNSISDYIINTTEAIQQKLFNGQPCKVLVVRNSAAQDLSETAKTGGENTVLVVGGHGDMGMLSMTDKTVSSEDIQIPEHKLKAFIQHTCASSENTGQEEMAKRFSDQVFGWTRATNPIDFIEKPLHRRYED